MWVPLAPEESYKIYEWYNCLRQVLHEKLILQGGSTSSMQHFFLFCIAKCHQFSWEIFVPGGPNISFAVVRLLWTVVNRSFMIQWNFDECYKWSVKESIMSEFDWTDFGEGHVEQSWKMTGNSSMTSVMAQCEACLMKWRNQWASITPFKTRSTPRDSSCELKKTHIRNWSRVGNQSNTTSSTNMQWLIWQ